MTHDFPTPWIVNYEYGCQVVTPQYHKAMVIAKTTDTSVATLIAAAPELLEALQKLLWAVRSNNEGGTPKTQDQIFAEAGHSAIAAIAKATGGAV